MKLLHGRSCPACGEFGLKDEECSHMTCEACGEEWCYFCGDSISAMYKTEEISCYDDHYVDPYSGEAKPDSCILFLYEVMNCDDSWPEGANEALQHFHKKLWLNKVRELKS